MNINNNTHFFGEDLKGKKAEFINHINTEKYCKDIILWQNVESQHWAFNFIVSFDDGTECAGTAIVEAGWIKTIYITGIADAGTFDL